MSHLDFSNRGYYKIDTAVGWEVVLKELLSDGHCLREETR